MRKVSRKNFYEKEFNKRFTLLDVSIRNISLYFIIPVPTLNQLYLEGKYKKIFKFIYFLELYRKFDKLPKQNVKLTKVILEHSGKTKYFPSNYT